MKLTFYSLLLTFFSLNTCFSQHSTDTTIHSPGIIIISTNPLRAAVDELSVFIEVPKNKHLGYGFSLGLVRPWKWIIDAGSFDVNLEVSDETILQASSYGAAIRGVVKWYPTARKGNSTYLALQPQYRLLFANHARINEYDSYNLLYAKEASMLAHRVGVQGHIGWQLVGKRIVNEIFMGVGTNMRMAKITYHAKIYPSGRKVGISEDESSGDKGISFQPTFHVGYKIGLMYKKR